MVHLSTITTKTGDDGTTGLADGSRLPKNHPRIQAIGAVDEVNAALGMARCAISGEERRFISHIQNDLFDLGADLALSDLHIQPIQVTWLEQEQVALNAELRPLDSFILPGGAPDAAALHLARTITRRAERAAVELNALEPINPEILRYLNRLSDFLFVLGRWCNDRGTRDILWRPGNNR